MNKEFLEKLEADLNFFTNLESPVQIAWHKALLSKGFDEKDPWHIFGAICASHPWFKDSKNAYHNAVHTAQVIWCGSTLVSDALIKEDKTWFPKFMLALMFHDVGHKGHPNKTPYQFEYLSAELFGLYMTTNNLESMWNHDMKHKYGDWDEFKGFVKQIIIATEVQNEVPNNIKSYLESEYHTLKQVLLVLAQEADILPSVLPNVGVKNGEKLAEEFGDSRIASDEGRLFFLNQVKFVSKYSNLLGIPVLIDEQKKELESKIKMKKASLKV